jgi:hypothetical protein
MICEHCGYREPDGPARTLHDNYDARFVVDCEDNGDRVVICPVCVGATPWESETEGE